MVGSKEGNEWHGSKQLSKEETAGKVGYMEDTRKDYEPEKAAKSKEAMHHC
jgi:hypothetical protein